MASQAAKFTILAIRKTNVQCVNSPEPCSRWRPNFRNTRRAPGKSDWLRLRLAPITAAAIKTCRRAPKIDNTRTELGWNPQMDMNGALRKIFEAYRFSARAPACLDSRRRN